MSNTNHTPTPWFVHDGNRNLVVTATNCIVADALGTDFDSETERANAAFIVRAANSHDQLVALLEEVVEAYEAHDRSAFCQAGADNDLVKRARAALAAAEAA